MTKDEIKAIVTKNGYSIIEEKRTGNNIGTMLKLNNGCIINCWDKGSHNCQGKNVDAIDTLLSGGPGKDVETNRKVFVVYGHDTNARTQLEAMLRRWDLEPLILEVEDDVVEASTHVLPSSLSTRPDIVLSISSGVILVFNSYVPAFSFPLQSENLSCILKSLLSFMRPASASLSAIAPESSPSSMVTLTVSPSPSPSYTAV